MSCPSLAWPCVLVIMIAPAVQATSPTIDLVLPPPETAVSGGNTTIRALLTVDLPPDASCAADLRYAMRLQEPVPQVDVRFEPAEGAFASADIRASSHLEQTVDVVLHVDAQREAYSRIDLLARAETAACGNLDATSVVSQTGTRVAFRPEVDLLLKAEDGSGWTVQAFNRANAPVILSWTALQPGAGRVLEQGEARLTFPPTVQAEFRVPKGQLDPKHATVLEGRILYGGNQTDGEAAPGSARLELYTPPPPRQTGAPLPMAILGAAGLAAAMARRRL